MMFRRHAWKNTVVLGAIVALLLTAGLLAYHWGTVREAVRDSAERETRESAREVFLTREKQLQAALDGLREDIAVQEEKLDSLKVIHTRTMEELRGVRRLSEDYLAARSSLEARVGLAAGGTVTVAGSPCTLAEAKAQVAEYDREWRSQQSRSVQLEAKANRESADIAAMAEDLRRAQNLHEQLGDRGDELMRRKSLAELRLLNSEMSSALGGMNPTAELTGSVRKLQEVFALFQAGLPLPTSGVSSPSGNGGDPTTGASHRDAH